MKKILVFILFFPSSTDTILTRPAHNSHEEVIEYINIDCENYTLQSCQSLYYALILLLNAMFIKFVGVQMGTDCAPPVVCFVCVEVLQPSQPSGVMSSAVSLPNHTLLGRITPLSG